MTHSDITPDRLRELARLHDINEGTIYRVSPADTLMWRESAQLFRDTAAALRDAADLIERQAATIAAREALLGARVAAEISVDLRQYDAAALKDQTDDR